MYIEGSIYVYKIKKSQNAISIKTNVLVWTEIMFFTVARKAFLQKTVLTQVYFYYS